MADHPRMTMVLYVHEPCFWYIQGVSSFKIPKTLHIILRAWLDDKSNCILDFAQLEIIPIMKNQEKIVSFCNQS